MTRISLKSISLAALAGLCALATASPSSAADLPRKAPAFTSRGLAGPGSMPVSTAATAGARRTGRARLPAPARDPKAPCSAAPSATTSRPVSGWAGPGRRSRLFVDQGLRDGNRRLRRRRLRNQKHLSCHRPRPHRLRLRSLAALHNRRRGARRPQDDSPTPALRTPDPNSDGRSAAALPTAFLGGWSVKAEYLYIDLGRTTCGAGTCGIDTDVKFKENLVRAGLNYRF